MTAFVLLAFWRLEWDLAWAIPFHLGVFTVTALLLHRRLAASRPPAERLTEFYLWLALGGALGGAFNALAAPLLFDSVVEYELLPVAACFLRPSASSAPEAMPGRAGQGAAALLPALVRDASRAYSVRPAPRMRIRRGAGPVPGVGSRRRARSRTCHDPRSACAPAASPPLRSGASRFLPICAGSPGPLDISAYREAPATDPGPAARPCAGRRPPGPQAPGRWRPPG